MMLDRGKADRRLVKVCVTMSWLTALCTSLASAQSAAVVGRVIESRSVQAIPGATLEIEGTRLGAVADAEGRYRIANVPVGSHTVIARHIGFTPVRQTVTVADGGQVTLNFVLQAAPIALDQVVITGTAGGERIRSIGNSVATIDAAEAQSLSASPNLGSLINARAPGVVMTQSTGRLGSGPSILIRGRSSLGLGNAPLVYVDGVRVNNATGLGTSGGGNGAAGSSVAGRLNDINPEDIASIEVIKGPAASTIYGTEASNGVIQIITKKGAVGAKPQFSLQAQYGALWLRDAADRLPTNYLKDSTGQIIAWNAVKQEAARGTPLFGTGHSALYSGSLSGARDGLRYYLSSSYEDSKGVEPNNYLRQYSLHANLDVLRGKTFDLASSLHFVDLRNHLGTDAGVSAMLGATVGHILLQPKARGFGLGYPPELSWRLYDNFENVNRFVGSGTINYRPTHWLSNRLVLGLDYAGADSRALERFAPPELAPFLTPTQASGRIAQTLRRDVNVTVDYSGTAKAELARALTSSSSVGLQVFRAESGNSSLGGMGFPAPGVETVSAAAVPLTSSQSQLVNTTIGAFAQEKLSWRDRLFLTAALRVDNNSAFGDDFKWVTYPKLDVSWVLNEEPFWRWGSVVQTMRLRAAYGESGRAPTAFSALRTFLPIQGPGGANAVTPASIGNPDLKPERAREVELGFEASLFDRVSLDFTYFRKRTVDEIVNQITAPSSGFSGSVPVNLGRVDNHGLELQTTLHALRRTNLEWVISGSVATAEDVIRDIGGLTTSINSAGSANRVGYPIGGVWSKRVVAADRDPASGKAINVLCDGGAGQPGVPCAQAPFVYLGTLTPKVSGAVSNTFTIARNLRLYALVDFQRGHIRLDRDALLRCTGAAGGQLCEANWYPDRYSPVYLASTVGSAIAQNLVSPYYDDASFAKLRELSASYTLPRRWIGSSSQVSITVAARELATWTGFSGTDPENSSQAVLPPLSRLSASLDIRF